MGVGDQVPPAIEQLGAKVEMISADDLAWGNLSRFDVDRHRRARLRAPRRSAREQQPAARLRVQRRHGRSCSITSSSSTTRSTVRTRRRCSSNRVTDEYAPVQIARAARSAVHDAERDRRRGVEGLGAGARTVLPRREGLALPRPRAARGSVSRTTPGAKTGALVEASYGKGRWVYVGLGLWRQLPVGHRRRVSAAREPDLAREKRLTLRLRIRDCRMQICRLESAICNLAIRNSLKSEIASWKSPLTPLEFARRTRRCTRDREAVVDGDAAPDLRAVLRALRSVVRGAAAARRRSRRSRRLHRAEHARAARVVLRRAADRRGRSCRSTTA